MRPFAENFPFFCIFLALGAGILSAVLPSGRVARRLTLTVCAADFLLSAGVLAYTYGRQISFVYNSYDINLKLQPRKADNYKYIVNPYYLVANNGRYYLIANHSRHDDISHYRVDKITNVYILDDTPARPLRTLPEYANGYDLPRHMAEHIYMFSGKSTYITMRIEPFMMDDIIDWFGKDFSILESNENHITIALHCNEEAMLYWALQYGKYVEILQPDSLREKLRSAAQNIYSKYVNPPSAAWQLAK